MSPRYEVHHTSEYSYEAQARSCVMSVCLQPRKDPFQHSQLFEISTSPNAPINNELDAFGNVRHVLNVHRPHRSLTIDTHSIVVCEDRERLVEAVKNKTWKEILLLGRAYTLWDYTHESPLTRGCSALNDFIERNEITPGGSPVDDLHRLKSLLFEKFDYVPGVTSYDSTIADILHSGCGVCQDFAHVMIAIARSWGVPTRYVSRYVFGNNTADSGTGSTSHAWVECLLSADTWIPFDPTNPSTKINNYIVIAHGRDFKDVSPTRGVLSGGGEMQLDVRVSIQEI